VAQDGAVKETVVAVDQRDAGVDPDLEAAKCAGWQIGGG
jgi:hypothetical protein